MLNEPALSGFTGNYRSDELDATYKVSLVKGALVADWDRSSGEDESGRVK